MMNIVFDTDILSIFAKADAIQYLERLFSKDHLLITPFSLQGIESTKGIWI